MNMYLITTGLAIFSMLFGAGNLIYPLMVGLAAGSLTPFAIFSFLASATALPLLGLFAMILFEGNYNVFFERIGKRAGQAIIFICMMIIGPIIAIPRITTLSFTMIAPFLTNIPLFHNSNQYSAPLFILIFLGITFLATYKENRIIEVLGAFISPVLLASLGLIILKGLLVRDIPKTLGYEKLLPILRDSFIRGYETLDLIGAIFFASIIVTLLQQKNPLVSLKNLSYQGLKAGIFGCCCLAIVYFGMSLLGMYHGNSFVYFDWSG